MYVVVQYARIAGRLQENANAGQKPKKQKAKKCRTPMEAKSTATPAAAKSTNINLNLFCIVGLWEF